MDRFKQLYVWAMNAKLFMGLYFVVLVALTGIVTAISGGNSLGLLSLLEMLGLSVIIALLQVVLLDSRTDYSKGILFSRSVIWVIFSTVLIVVASIAFKWFAGLPAWGPYLLAGFILIALPGMLLGLKWEQETDTVRLNADLDSFKSKEGVQ